MRRPLIGVLALQGDVREHAACLEQVGADVMTVRRPSELDRIDGLVIPGGESTTIAKLARTFDLFEPLRQRIKAGMPTYGSCAGMILLADRIVDGTADQETFGGIDMLVRRNAFGRQVESFESPLELHDLDDSAPVRLPYKGVFIRAPWVESVGPDVVTVASISSGTAAGRIVAVRQGHLLATSFHPELTGDVRIHAYFAAMVARQSES